MHEKHIEKACTFIYKYFKYLLKKSVEMRLKEQREGMD